MPKRKVHSMHDLIENQLDPSIDLVAVVVVETMASTVVGHVHYHSSCCSGFWTVEACYWMKAPMMMTMTLSVIQ